MRLLLDTHTLLWVFDSSPALSVEARNAISEGENQVFASAATAWEIAIKRSIGKLSVRVDYARSLQQYRFTPLDITNEHALAVEDLPFHHRDPFDRLLIAQAMYERLTLVTRDRRFDQYDVRLLKA